MVSGNLASYPGVIISPIGSPYPSMLGYDALVLGNAGLTGIEEILSVTLSSA